MRIVAGTRTRMCDDARTALRAHKMYSTAARVLNTWWVQGCVTVPDDDQGKWRLKPRGRT